MGELVTRQHARQQRSSHRAQAPILIHNPPATLGDSGSLVVRSRLAAADA
jgi:hypothetical protein